MADLVDQTRNIPAHKTQCIATMADTASEDSLPDIIYVVMATGQPTEAAVEEGSNGVADGEALALRPGSARV